MVQISSQQWLSLLSLLAMAGNPASGNPITGRAPNTCYSQEGSSLLCYHTVQDWGKPANVDLSDVAYAAGYLRHYGKTHPDRNRLTMTTADSADCMEWTVYSYQTVLVLAKRIGVTTNSSVLYTDIANTIDGGEAPTSAAVAASLTGCGADGGSLGVVINSTDPVYQSPAYTAAGYTPNGIIIKIVHS